MISKQDVIDQSAHAGLGLVITLPILTLPYSHWAYFACGIVALLAGISREVAQMMKAKQGWYMDRTIDSLFHIPGGILVAGIAHMIAVL